MAMLFLMIETTQQLPSTGSPMKAINCKLEVFFSQILLVFTAPRTKEKCYNGWVILFAVVLVNLASSGWCTECWVGHVVTVASMANSFEILFPRWNNFSQLFRS